MRPGPTARTVPSCGFSLAVSGMTMPEAVVVSASLACTTRRSSRGLMLTLVAVTSDLQVSDQTIADGWLALGWPWHELAQSTPAVAGVSRAPVGTLIP